MIPENQLQIFRNYIESFNPIEEEAWKDIIPFIQLRILPKGKYYITPEEGNSNVGLILSGLLRTYFLSSDGEEFTTDFCSSVSIAANYSLIGDQPSSSFFSVAMEQTHLLQLQMEEFIPLTEKWPSWKDFFTGQMQHYYNEKILREKELLSLGAEERYNLFRIKYTGLIDKIPQYHIASYLGIKPETLSRIRKKSNID